MVRAEGGKGNGKGQPITASFGEVDSPDKIITQLDPANWTQ